jgi:hypothetical protein
VRRRRRAGVAMAQCERIALPITIINIIHRIVIVPVVMSMLVLPKV